MTLRAVKPEDIRKSQPLVPREHREHDIATQSPTLYSPNIRIAASNRDRKGIYHLIVGGHLFYVLLVIREVHPSFR